MIGVIFPHRVDDDPYKQSDVEKGFNRIEKFCEDRNEKLFYSFQDKQRHYEIYGINLEDDYIIVHHTVELSHDEKAELADCIRQALTVKKTVYKNEVPEIVIVFQKISDDDCFTFNVK